MKYHKEESRKHPNVNQSVYAVLNPEFGTYFYACQNMWRPSTGVGQRVFPQIGYLKETSAAQSLQTVA